MACVVVATMQSLPKFTLVLGGASCGKTQFAERLVVGSGLRPVHIATAQPLDDEMKRKIERHRSNRGDQWINHDAPLDPTDILDNLPPDCAVLFDCATMWLTNATLADSDYSLPEMLDRCTAPLVIVSNEIGCGIVPEHAMVRRFRIQQGELNQHLAARADLVVLITAGLPLIVKGRLPAWA